MSAKAASQRRIGWTTLVGLVVLVVLATAIGLGSAWLVLKRSDGFGARVGPWRANLLAGSADADPYTRARVAVGGLLALNRAETMYYVAATDSDGQPLRSRCSYRVSGPPPKARWWSLTAYAEDYFLFPNEQRRYSVNGLSAPVDAKGAFTLISGPTDPGPTDPGLAGLPWLPTPGDRGLMFTLRVYNPEGALQAAPASLEAPRIERLAGCA